MCGIYGYIGPKNAAKVCIEGLKLLEYRGYDSAGVAGSYQGTIQSCKEIGKLHHLEASVNALSLTLSNAIAHTRWATHGKPSKENCHPLFDQHHHIAVVHNGIIENHFTLRQQLQKQGIQFCSQTDTEVIAQLIAYYYEGDLVEAVQKALSELKGFWAIAAIHKDHPDEIVAATKENPLAIGTSPCQKESFLSSDVNAFYSPELDVLFLGNHETAKILPTGVQVFNASSTPIVKHRERLSMQDKKICKNGFDHFMLKEIFEQPHTIHQAMQGKSEEMLHLPLSKQELSSVEKIFILACGTSWHAGCIAAAWLEELAGIPCRAEIASEFRYRNSPIPPNTLAIAISQSGETFDTLAAIRNLKQKQAKVLAICNVKNSTLTRDADACLFLNAGPEISVCSTKAFTSQLATLFLFVLHLARIKNRITPEEEQAFLQDLHKLPGQAELILRQKDTLCYLAKKYASYPHFFFLGRGYMYPTCLEAALKLKEISYLNATGYPAGEMKHGPIALADASLGVIGLCGDESVLDKTLSNLMEVKSRGAPLLLITSHKTDEIDALADDLFFLPPICKELAPIPYSIAMQILAYYIALEKGADIDQPRNLAKSVTVE